jgi:transcriptional regulator with XRE-family HTH domain
VSKPWAPVGRRLRAERVLRGLTQEQVAADVGIRQEDVSRDELGRVVAPERVALYCGYYGLRWEELLAVLYDRPAVGVPRARSVPSGS